jgi:hypothetical protein
MVITPKWREVLQFYRTLSENEKSKFLNTLSHDQRDYLIVITSQFETHDSKSSDEKSEIHNLNYQDRLSLSDKNLLDEKKELEYRPAVISKVNKDQIILSSDSKNNKNSLWNKVKGLFKNSNFKKIELNSITLSILGFFTGLMTFMIVGTVSIYARGEDPIKSFSHFSKIIDVRSEFQKKESLIREFNKFLDENGISDKSTDFDTDEDGLSNFDEFLLESNIFEKDSNKDGTTDAIEYLGQKYPSNGKIIPQRELELLQDNISQNFDIFLRIINFSSPDYSFDNKFEIDGQILKIDYSKTVFLDFDRFAIKDEPISLNKTTEDFNSKIKSDNLTNYPSSNILSKGSSVFIFPDPNNSSKDSLKRVYLTKNFVEPGNLLNFKITTEDGQLVKAVYRVNYNNVLRADSDKFFENKNISQITMVIPLLDENYTTAEIIRASLVSVEIVN